MLGPDDGFSPILSGASDGLNWYIDGEAGDIFHVAFERLDGVKKVSMSITGHEQLSEDLLASLQADSRIRYSIVGTWDDFMTPIEMTWDGECYKHHLQLGSTACESFHLLLDGRRDLALYPSRKDATPNSFYLIQGPSPAVTGLNWTIGKHECDKGRRGQWCEIKLLVDAVGDPETIRWKKYWQ